MFQRSVISLHFCKEHLVMTKFKTRILLPIIVPNVLTYGDYGLHRFDEIRYAGKWPVDKIGESYFECCATCEEYLTVKNFKAQIYSRQVGYWTFLCMYRFCKSSCTLYI